MIRAAMGLRRPIGGSGPSLELEAVSAVRRMPNGTAAPPRLDWWSIRGLLPRSTLLRYTLLQESPDFVLHQPPTILLAASWTVGPIELAAILLLAGAVVALVVALRGGWPGAAQPPASSPTHSHDARAAADELRGLIAEARTLSDELADQFDQRSEELRRLLAEAERLSPRPQIPIAQHELKPPSPPSPPAPPSIAEVEAIASRVRGYGGEVYADPNDPDPIAREIYRLSDSGLPPVEIAGRLGQHTGKVELILALRQ